MNNKTNAINNIEEFLRSEERGMLLTGTHQNKKHTLILAALSELKNKATILFRVNGMDNVGSFLNNHDRRYETGHGYRLGVGEVYIDSINSASWNKTPHHVDYAILYPIDSVCRMKNKDRVISDLLKRVEKKIFFVSWTDVHDYSWLDPNVDRKVVYDAEEEDPAYHERVIKLLNKDY